MAITPEPFDALLAWLDSDREVAGRKYETIRTGLIRIFVAKGFNDAEDLADEAITRVVKRLPEIRDSYVGEPARYFHGVARNLLRESYRRKEIATDVSPVACIQITNRSDEYECLMRCLQFLTPTKRDLILDYHDYEGHDKIEQHEIMAQELGISKGALRLRAHHIRAELEKCVLQCAQTLKKETKEVAAGILSSGAGQTGASAMAEAEEYTIRAYLLGQLTEADAQQVEVRLLSEPDFAEEYDIVVNELTDDYIAGKFEGEELKQVEEHFFKSSERRNKLKFALALKERKSERIADNGRTQSRFKPYLAIAAAVVLLAGGGLYLWRVMSNNSDLNKGLAALQSAFRQERPIEARISKFDYAPYLTTRGSGPDRIDQDELRRAELTLLDEQKKNPSPAVHHGLGKVYLAKREFDKAIKEFDEALKGDPKNAELQSDLGAALLEQANGLDKENGGGKILETLGRSLQHLDEALRTNPSLLEALFNKALCLQRMKSNSEAREAWQQYLARDPNSSWAQEARGALKTLEEKNRSATSASDVLACFLAAHKRKDDERAWTVLSQTREMVTDRMIPLQLAREFLNGDSRGSKTEADAMLAALIYAAKLEHDRAGDPYFMHLANYYSKTNQAQRALLIQAQAQLLKGFELYLKSSYQPALEHFRMAQARFSEAHDTWEEKLAFYWIANCEAQNDSLAKSADRLHKLVEFSRERNYGWLLSQALWLLASDYYLLGEYSRSIQLDGEAVESAERVSDLYNQQKIFTQLATKYRQVRRPQYALSYHNRSLELAGTEFASTRQAWRTYTSVAQTFYALKNFDAAAAYQREALQLVNNIKDSGLLHSSYIQLAQIYVASHQYADATSAIDLSFQAAEALKDDPVYRRLKAYSTLQLAHLKRQEGDLQEALSKYGEAILLYDLMEFDLDKYDAHKGRLLCYLETKDDTAIEKELQVVLGIFEKNRARILEEQNRNNFFDAEQSVYDLAIDYELSKGHNEQAFDYSEKSRARSLLDALRNDGTRTTSSGESDLSFSSATQPLPFSELREHLPPQIQILQFSVLEDQVVTWLISNSELRVYQKSISQTELTEKIGRYMNALTKKEPSVDSDLKQESAALYELLISPIDNKLDKRRPLYVIPDKILFQLSFGSLVSNQTGAYLLKDFQLSFAPSLNVLASCSKSAKQHTRTGDETLLSIGNPAFDHRAYPDLNDLPAADREVAEIDRAYVKVTSLTGQAATKEIVEKNLVESDVVHFAGHYVVDEATPMRSRLLLAPSPAGHQGQADGTLTAGEVFGLHLRRPRLLVLSACQTGAERYYGGEGVVGMARTFLASGVPVVVASQWPVDSEATADLMIAFHHYRKQQGMSTVAALRQAQVDMLDGPDQRYRDPYCWAAFVPVGGYATF